MAKYEIYKSKDQGEQCWRWRFRGNNDEIIADSEESFF